MPTIGRTGETLVKIKPVEDLVEHAIPHPIRVQLGGTYLKRSFIVQGNYFKYRAMNIPLGDRRSRLRNEKVKYNKNSFPSKFQFKKMISRFLRQDFQDKNIFIIKDIVRSKRNSSGSK